MDRGTKVEDVMTRQVLTVSEDTPLKDVVAVMHEHAVSGVPVVDPERRLVGIVTEADVLALEAARATPREQRRSFLEWLIRPARLAEVEDQAVGLRAWDVMTTRVVSVGPATSVAEAARILLEAVVKRLPVVDEAGRVVGIVSRGDLLRPFLRGDAEIAGEIREDVLLRTMWIDPASLRVEVRKGVVELEGELEQRSLKEILLGLVRRVDGVVGVEDRLRYRIDDRAVRAEARSELARGENWVRRL